MSTRTRVSQDKNGFTPTESTDTPLSSLLPRRVHATLAISPLQLCGGLSGIEKPGGELTYARVKCYICRMDGDPQLGINRFESPLLLGYEDSFTALHVTI